MLRAVTLGSIVLSIICSPAPAAHRLRGTYVEARTCQVYTGPCFANGEVGLTGKDAIMTWQINDGTFAGVDLAGLSVAVAVQASDTLGFDGLSDAQSIKAVVIVDSLANSLQADALEHFALCQTGIRNQDVAAVHRADIDLHLDLKKLTAKLSVGEYARLVTRQARPGDCICSNESAYYPPLAPLKGFVPGVTIDGEVTARRLGTRWSIPDSRTAYMGTFDVDAAESQMTKGL